MERVPPGAVFAEDTASDRVPVCLRVLDAGNSLAISWAGDRPAGFGDPNRLAGRGGNGLIEGAEKGCVGVADGVVDRVLIVRVGVHAEEVNGGGHSGVGRVDPSSVGVDMANRRADPCIGQDGAYLANVGNEGVGLLASASGCADGCKSVKIFTADGDASNQVCESRAILGDGAAESRKFIVEGVLRL